MRATSNSYVAQAFYSGAKGAKLVHMESFYGEVWVIDCDAEVNATFLIGGRSYPIHPLDMNQQGTDDNGKDICFGAVRAISSYRKRGPSANPQASSFNR